MPKMIRILIASTGIVIFLWFFVPGILTGHFHIGVMTGTVIGLIFIAYALFFSRINSFFRFLWRHVTGKVIIIAASALILGIIVLAIMCMVSMGRGMKRSADSQQGTVIVLGCRVYSYGPSLMLKARMDAACEYLNDNPGSICIVCGGQGSNEPESEADAMYTYMTGKGIEPSRIYKDGISEDTNENLTNAAEIIKQNDLDQKCAIVTSDYHCYRALKNAERLGYEDPAAIPADTLWWLFPSAYVREMYGILEMWLLK